MHKKTLSRIASFVAILLFCSNETEAQITSVVTEMTSGSERVSLQSIGMFRGPENFFYPFEELILGNISAVNIPGSFRTVILSEDGYPASGAPDGLINDEYLNTGLFTPGLGDGNFQLGDEFTEYTFTQPVVNDTGADLLLSFITFQFSTFESEPGPYWLSPDGATPVQIDRDADIDLGALSGIPYYFYPAGGPTNPTDFLDPVAQSSGSLGNSNATPRPSLQIIDLSDLGIAEGDSINSLRIWDDDLSNGNTIYTTLIAGLPSLPQDGDFDEDGDIDGTDFLIWQQDSNIGSLGDWETNFGTSAPLPATVAIPEPTSLLLVFVTVLCCSIRRCIKC